MIIAVGYRVNSKKATQFRICATKVLKEYMIKGFVIDKELLKKGGRFTEDYFDELLERLKRLKGRINTQGVSDYDLKKAKQFKNISSEEE